MSNAPLPKPDYTEQRGDRVLLVWGDIPFWVIVDRLGARLIDELVSGRTFAAALDAIRPLAPDRGYSLDRDAADLYARLKHAGLLGGKVQPPPPERIESISVNVTALCNLGCRHCYYAFRKPPRDEVEARVMIRALETVRRDIARGATLRLSGGEPLLERDKTLALARWGARRGLRPIVSTNGLLVDAEFAEAAAKIGLEVQVSLDGATAAAHDDLRGEGRFEKALHAVEVLKKAGAHTIVSMVFHPGNVDEVPDFLRLADRLGVDEARFVPVKRISGGKAFRTPPLADVLRQVVRAVAAEPELARLLGRDYATILARNCHACARREGCAAGCQTFLLDADGTIYPCANLLAPEFAVGNVTSGNLGKIWRSSDALESLIDKMQLSSRPETCGACFLRHWCLGGCRGEAYAATGDLNGEPPTCKHSRAAILEMFWTLGEKADHPWLLEGSKAVGWEE